MTATLAEVQAHTRQVDAVAPTIVAAPMTTATAISAVAVTIAAVMDL
jgi:hypothetical protein